MAARKYAPICSVDGCDDDHFSKGYCGKHHYYFKKYGDSLHRNVKTLNGSGLAFIKAIIPTDECVMYPYGLNAYGYPQVSGTLGNRLSLEVHEGPAPTSKHQAAHKCGVKACVNPRHLYWATPKENTSDKVLHGTQRRGEDCYNSVLTEEKVKSIRASDLSYSTLAREHGVSRMTINNVKKRRAWKHVD